MRHPPRTITRSAAIFVAGLIGLALAPAAPAAAAPNLSVEESRADELVSTINANQETYAGVSLEEGTGTLTVRYAKKAGQAAAQSRISKFTAQRSASGVRTWRVQFVAAEHSAADLEAVRQKVVTDPEWLRTAGDTVSEWYVDIRRNRVAIGVTTLTPAVEATASKLSNGLASLHIAARPDRAATRVDDFEPWVAGSRIVLGGSGCTGGFIIRNVATPTLRRLVTAGHCGALGTTVRNNGDVMGTVVSRNFTEDGLDVEYVGGSTYTAWTYKGPPTSDFGDAIRGTRISLVGRTYCTNGATSGEVCSGTVAAINVCTTFSDGITTCSLDRMTSTGFTLTRPGDSGGNIFAYDSVGLKIGGIIIGGSGSTAYFHSYHFLIPSGWAFDTT